MAAGCGKYVSTNHHYPIILGAVPQKLSKTEIFNRLAEKTCRVKWEWQDITLSTTGCFIKRLGQEKVQVLTCFHDESWKTACISMIYKIRIDEDLFICTTQCTLDPKISLRNATKVDLCLLNIQTTLTPSYFYETTNDSSYLSLGETVYFSGFPLLKEHPLIHKGCISSKEKKENFAKFSIDGTVVEGHSGGPVVIVNNENLELIGIINSQMVSITTTLIKSSKMNIEPVSAFNDFSSSYGDSDVRTVLQDLVNNFFRNVSTGIGNATSTTHLPFLFEATAISPPELNSNPMESELPTAITKKGSYQIQDPRTAKRKDVEFSMTAHELRTPGKGPRGLIVSIDGLPNSKYTYRLPNPHNGNYNNHVEKVYDAALSQLVDQYALNQHMPQNIQFEVKKVSYDMTLEKQPVFDYKNQE